MKSVAVIVAIVLVYANALDDNEILQKWTKFQTDFGKTYRSPVEASKRLSIFKSNLELMEAHNAKYENGEETYTMGINQFSDWSADEFKAYVSKGLVTENFKGDSEFVKTPGYVAASSVDWRNQGLVTGVKNQGTCEGCWAFSATGGLEGQYAKNGNTLTSFSEQDLIDCSKNGRNDGCNGGLMTSAFDYVKKNGIVSESDYPFTGRDGKCKASKYTVVTKSSSYTNIREGDEDALTEAIEKHGPVCVGLNGSATGFQLYSGGIFSGSCSSSTLNHGVLAVGFGSQNGQNYYIVKNSWGTTWGEQGYIRLARNDNNKCGIASMAVYVQI